MMTAEVISILGGMASVILVCAGVFSATSPTKHSQKQPEQLTRIELSDEEMSNFNWLDTCPDCGKIDHHPFVPIEESGERYTIITENVRGLAVIKRTCTSPKCGFTWFQK